MPRVSETSSPKLLIPGPRLDVKFTKTLSSRMICFFPRIDNMRVGVCGRYSEV